MINRFGLYDDTIQKSSCGVGFITRKDSKQTHELLKKSHEALCAVPHRGGMSSQGTGDGAGISIDLSGEFFSKITSKDLKSGDFCVGNFFLPNNPKFHNCAGKLIEKVMLRRKMSLLKSRIVPVNKKILSSTAKKEQLLIKQWIFKTPKNINPFDLERETHEALLEIESKAFTSKNLYGLYPLSLSTKIQVLKGRLNANELIPYFLDLQDKKHKIHTLYFHTRFSTNTDPHPSMAQPFRLMAHNGELNTDKKNRLSENAVFMAKKRNIIRPKGQSDSCRFDQTLKNRIVEDELDIVSAVVSMVPPAWENDDTLSEKIKAMFEYFSLYEEKNDGPAALIFGDGDIIGARLDRLGLRPLRTVETDNYISVMSEAGQIKFPEETIISRGRIEAGGILYYDHKKKKLFNTRETYELMANQKDYVSLLKENSLKMKDLGVDELLKKKSSQYDGDLNTSARYVAYYHNQESFKFLVDPMLENGVEKVSAMGYGKAINALTDSEGGTAKYFSQRFAQVTNPPLDSIRESDGMTLRVALGSKVNMKTNKSPQIILDSPILEFKELEMIKNQNHTPVKTFNFLYTPNKNQSKNQQAIKRKIEILSKDINKFVNKNGGIVILSDRNVSSKQAALPMTVIVSAVNQGLINQGLRFKTSLIVESGQISSPHHVACALGFGASAVYSICSEIRCNEKYSDKKDLALKNFKKACEKSLMKIMGKVGLCTVESYSGGEFFEPNFLDTNDSILKEIFPNLHSPVGGVGFKEIAQSLVDWHNKSRTVKDEKEIPILGLFKERTEGAGHSFGLTAVRGFIDLTEEEISFSNKSQKNDNQENMRLLTLNNMGNALGITEKDFKNTNFEILSKSQINNFKITSGYRSFSTMMKKEREQRPAALRDILVFPIDLNDAKTKKDFLNKINMFDTKGNNNFLFKGLKVKKKKNTFTISFDNKKNNLMRFNALDQALKSKFLNQIKTISINDFQILLKAKDKAFHFLDKIKSAPISINLNKIQPACEITESFASGAMSHGALVASAHEAIAHGTNMVGAFSNSGEGGEHMSRYGTVRASKIKQLASGRFGVWTGYLADPMLKEIEIKIAQGAKPGEGGQLPAAKVNVEIAAARNGTPGVELVSPPPHHDTYSIEDLAQLIHDAKAARVRVIVKLVSSDGIGTIGVGVAKAGADVINIAGGTGGTGAANVTSLKYTGRAAEIGLAEVHQALLANNLRQKVLLRCSGAHQTGSDVVKSALIGADSFEFGTTAMMMMKCVMAKNCNIKCPAGITTNAEVFNGDPRVLAQYYLNVAHEVREILAKLGFKSLRDIRGRYDLLHLLNHKSSVGQISLKKMLTIVKEKRIKNPKYLEKNFDVDEKLLKIVKDKLLVKKKESVNFKKAILLSNKNKTFGGQFSIDLERLLNHEKKNVKTKSIFESSSGIRFLDARSVIILTNGSAGQSYGAFCNNGMVLRHKGTCNDGVGKSACGGEIIINNPSDTKTKILRNVLVGNFALFGATGGRLFVEGEAGDRFAVRNSGATAVVEGVGEYCAEYMTNGTILNLGTFSRGFGNGMSGGFAYQYDPKKVIKKNISKESVLFNYLDGKTEISNIHEETIFTLLNWHFNATKSRIAQYIIDNWSTEKFNMVYITPKAFLQYQDYEEILSSKSRKGLVDELSEGMAIYQIEKFKNAWASKKNILEGEVPDKNDMDSSNMYELINNWTVLESAQKIVKSTFDKKDLDKTTINKMVKNLILTEDFKLMSRLLKHSREAISHYNDKELAVMIANKRLNDFKKALHMKNVMSVDSLSTYGWILYQQKRNKNAIKKIQSYEELFYNQTVPELVVNS